MGDKSTENSVALDVVNFGEEDKGKPKKLEALVVAMNNIDRSHVMHVPCGPSALFDVLIRSFFWLFDSYQKIEKLQPGWETDQLRKLKKNSVALDVVNFGEEDKGKPKKLEALVVAMNNIDISHVMHVPRGPSALFDVLIVVQFGSCLFWKMS
ncbi:unnamed protein product [Fraxinus pennsylvanica]|uniref:Uncharacterized protein n=1 Tax=Fraxinus pennsylvanica TaxID=56036 RepID=A0AAD2DJF9_9LAMI|nr:unnamed protein product [Fraxinus pennsylvanica]